MLYPPLNQLTSKVKSKYLIATVAAKRARELYDKKDTALLEKYH
ncbi:DNA-directed RNA polymerase subunit omega, partial [Burkholderia multivorans]